jgi:DNA-binding response OmpR family regulator
MDEPHRMILLGAGSSSPQVGDIIKRIRKTWSEKNMSAAPIIAIAKTGERKQCLQAGFDDIVANPVQLEMLQELTERWAPQGEESLAIERISTELLTALKRRRTSLCLSLSELSELTGIPEDQLLRIENGEESLTVAQLIKMGFGLNIVVSDLIREAQSKCED